MAKEPAARGRKQQQDHSACAGAAQANSRPAITTLQDGRSAADSAGVNATASHIHIYVSVSMSTYGCVPLHLKDSPTRESDGGLATAAVTASTITCTSTKTHCQKNAVLRDKGTTQ